MSETLKKITINNKIMEKLANLCNTTTDKLTTWGGIIVGKKYSQDEIDKMVEKVIIIQPSQERENFLSQFHTYKKEVDDLLIKRKQI